LSSDYDFHLCGKKSGYSDFAGDQVLTLPGKVRGYELTCDPISFENPDNGDNNGEKVALTNSLIIFGTNCFGFFFFFSK